MKLWPWKRQPNGENGAVSKPTEPAADVTLKIELRNGQVSVVGPLANKVLCYGLLTAAQDAVRNYRAPEPLVKPAAVMPEVSFLDPHKR